MKFEILSVKQNSVRVTTGIVTFDVKVIDCGNGSYRIQTPKGIYINAENFRVLSGAVKAAYITTIQEYTTNETERETSIQQ